jgi:steroid 5-alpha reductase family enzyme
VTAFEIVELTFLLSVFAVTACWSYALRHGHDLSIIDGYYGFASLVHGSATYVLWGDRTSRGLVLTALASLWALGLGQSLLRRWARHRGLGGDVRYQKAAATLGLERRGGFWWKSYLTLVLPQAMLMTVINLPVQLAIMIDVPALRWTDLVGFAVIAVGACTEVGSNLQLERYKKSGPAPGSTLTRGFFAWSRHPNYFGHFSVFLGAYIVAWSDPSLWWTIVSPLAIFVVLRWGILGTGVHGIDKLMLEKRSGNQEYLSYVRRTPAFFPLPPALGGARVRLQDAAPHR